MRRLSSRLGSLGSLRGINIGVMRDASLVAAVAFLLGRTVLAGTLAPFGPAFYGGLRSLGIPSATLCGLVSLLGSASLGRWDLLGYHALAMALVTGFVRSAPDRKSPAALDALLTGGIIAIARGVANALQSPTLYSYVSALLEGLCAAVIAAIGALALSPRRDTDASVRERSAEAFLVLTVLSLGGLYGFSIMGVSIEVVAVMASCLVAGYAAGPGAGAVAGLAGGLIITLTGNEDPAILGIAGISGVLGGIGGWFGKWEAIAAYMSGGLVMSLYASAPDQVAARLVEQSLSCGAILLVTPGAVSFLREKFPVLTSARERSTPLPIPDASSLRTAAIAHALMEMGKMLSQAAPTSATTARIGELQPLEQDEISEKSPRTPREDASFIRQVANRVCGDCEGRAVCWEERFGDTYEALTGISRKLQVVGQVVGQADKDVHAALADTCLRFREVLKEASHHQEVQRLENRLRALDSETKEVLSFQFRSLGQLLLTKPNVQADRPRRDGRRLKVTFKGGSMAAQGASRPGDMWVKYDLSPGRTLAVLVDGMGKGDAAANQSKETLEILKSLLGSGLDYDSCVSFLNSALYLCCRPDSFVAVDCVLIDQDTERAYFHKLGAPPSFIRKKDGNVLVVRSLRPPAGAFVSMASFSTSEPISPGDEIYLVSDGMFRSSPIPGRAEHLLVSRLRRLKDLSLDASVKALLSYGQKFRPGGPPDDITVVAARVEQV